MSKFLGNVLRSGLMGILTSTYVQSLGYTHGWHFWLLWVPLMLLFSIILRVKWED